MTHIAMSMCDLGCSSAWSGGCSAAAHALLESTLVVELLAKLVVISATTSQIVCDVVRAKEDETAATIDLQIQHLMKAQDSHIEFKACWRSKCQEAHQQIESKISTIDQSSRHSTLSILGFVF